jgi:hypothetical protein
MGTATNTRCRLVGEEIGSCNCAWGCPCQFNALPTTAAVKRSPPCRSVKSTSGTHAWTGCGSRKFSGFRALSMRGTAFREAEMGNAVLLRVNAGTGCASSTTTPIRNSVPWTGAMPEVRYRGRADESGCVADSIGFLADVGEVEAPRGMLELDIMPIKPVLPPDVISPDRRTREVRVREAPSV